MNRMIHHKSREEKLEELTRRLEEEQSKNPNEVNARIADLSYRILKLKKALKINTPKEQSQLIGMMLEHAYVMKTGLRDRNVAKSTFKKILQLDPKNSEANYRYAFLYYEDRKWIQAINHFQQAIQYVDADFPLADDQIIKANLFISYCSVMMAKESLAQAESLLDGEVEAPPNEISIDKLTMKIKNELDNTEFRLFTNQGKELISKQAYMELESNIEFDEILLDLATEQSFIQSGGKRSEITRHQAILLKKLLLKSADGEALSLTDITGYQEESVSNDADVSWESYRKKISLLKQALAEIGLPTTLIENIPKVRRYKISSINYYIVQYDAK